MTLKLRHVITLSLLLAEIIAVIWWFPYLPMTDLPEHMLAARVLTHYDAPDANYPAFFSKRFPWNPYSSYFLFVLATDPIVGVRNATRLYLTLAFVLTLVSFWWWIRTVAPGRDAQIIPATLLLFGLFFYIGLINFLFSAPFVFFALVFAWRLQERPTLERTAVAGLAASIMLAYLSHIVTFGLCLLVVGAQALLIFRGRRLTRLILPIVPSLVLLAVYWFVQARNDVTSLALEWDSLSDRLATLLMPFNIFNDFQTHHWMFDYTLLTLWSLVLVIMLAGRLLRKPDSTPRSSTRRAWAIALMFVAGTLLLPSNLAEGLGVALRAAYFAAFAFLVLLPVDWDDRVILRGLMVATCAVSPLVLAYQLTVFSDEMAGLEKVIDRIPPAKVIQPVITEAHSTAFHTYPHQHAAAWYSYYKGGISPYLFTSWANHFPARSRQKFVPETPGEWTMGKFRYETHQRGTDYFLVRTRDESIIADLREHVPLLARSGEWQVFGPNLQDADETQRHKGTEAQRRPQ